MYQYCKTTDNALFTFTNCIDISTCTMHNEHAYHEVHNGLEDDGTSEKHRIQFHVLMQISLLMIEVVK